VEPFAPEEFVARVRRAVTRAAAFRSINERPTHTLTVREVEVLEGLANGLSQNQIAQQLIISPKTVGTHIQRILSKLDVHSRAEAVAAAYQRGIVGQASVQSGPVPDAVAPV
jgi:DNA-binding NarL/FixJ family response regulator